MKLINPEGLLTISVKNVSKSTKPCLLVWRFVGFIGFNKSFTNKLWSNTGIVIHFLGFRFTNHCIHDSMCYMSPKDEKLLKKYRTR